MTTREPVLCYVEDQWAYFTTQPLDKQWGDDWDDCPFECNSGRPYSHHPGYDQGREPWEIVKVAWDGSFYTPGEGHTNGHWSVKAINAGGIAWLRPDPYCSTHKVFIMAGTPLSEFIEKVKSVGGKVYVAV